MRNKRIHIILATTLFAILLWGSINMSYQYQVTAAAPLVIENIPAGRAIKTPVPHDLQMRFRGTGWRLAPLVWGSELTYALDLKTIPATQNALTLNDIAENLNLPAGIQPLDMKPDSIYILLDSQTQKRVPVILDHTVTFREGYGQVGNTIVTPESVTIGGAKSLLQRIDLWATTRISFENLKAPVDTDVPLAESASYMLSFSPPSVHVRINVQPFAEKTIPGLTIRVHSVPPNREVILIPPKIDIVVRGNIEQLSELTGSNFEATVDYDAILADTSGYVDARIDLPPGLQVVNRRPERHQYIVRKRL
ncbi:MAG: CdaR family protein [Ignavibacteria bacterium]|nr:CdaR family protein [Ignavibacteria bacterium]